jgi:hypothetical protein
MGGGVMDRIWLWCEMGTDNPQASQLDLDMADIKTSMGIDCFYFSQPVALCVVSVLLPFDQNTIKGCLLPASPLCTGNQVYSILPVDE